MCFFGVRDCDGRGDRKPMAAHPRASGSWRRRTASERWHMFSFLLPEENSNVESTVCPHSWYSINLLHTPGLDPHTRSLTLCSFTPFPLQFRNRSRWMMWSWRYSDLNWEAMAPGSHTPQGDCSSCPTARASTIRSTEPSLRSPLSNAW